MPEIQRIDEPIKVLKSAQVPPTNAQVTKVLVGGVVAYVRENVLDEENVLELLAPIGDWTRISTVIALEDDRKRDVHPAPADFTEDWARLVMGEPIGGLPIPKEEIRIGTLHDCDESKAAGSTLKVYYDDMCGSFPAFISKVESGWWLGEKEVAGMSVKFCPFCGKKLDEV